ncbi:MAG: MOSC domain-containing protein [Cyanobacteriota bacterium]
MSLISSPDASAPGPGDRVGHVASLWRYPVKSMLGERLERLAIEPRGVVGDRSHALWDLERRKVASAKNPRPWAELLRFRAWFEREPVRGQPLPAVLVQGPFHGPEGPTETLRGDDPSLESRLSARFGRQLRLLDQPPEAASLDHYWPDVDGREFQDVTNELRLPEGTFFDACPIHALTNASLERYRRLEPQLDFAVERFRPNILIQTEGLASGFVEEAWVGGVLAIGDAVRLRVDRDCPRCVITTLPQGELPEAMDILRATARHNRVVAGIRLSVVEPGAVAVGDPLHWWPS